MDSMRRRGRWPEIPGGCALSGFFLIVAILLILFVFCFCVLCFEGRVNQGSLIYFAKVYFAKVEMRYKETANRSRCLPTAFTQLILYIIVNTL